jgi:hypothetical protein
MHDHLQHFPQIKSQRQTHTNTIPQIPPTLLARLKLVQWESNCFVHRILSVAKSRMAGAQMNTDFCHLICHLIYAN